MLLLTYWYCILLWRDRGVLAHLQELCPESIYALEIEKSITAESNYTNHEEVRDTSSNLLPQPI
jgi:hypothetical protein